MLVIIMCWLFGTGCLGSPGYWILDELDEVGGSMCIGSWRLCNQLGVSDLDKVGQQRERKMEMGKLLG